MPLNPYQSPRPLPGEEGDRSLKDGRWSLTLTGFFAGGYVGAWVGSLSGAGVGVLFALLTGAGAVGYRNPAFAFVEDLIRSGLLFAILGTLGGVGLGAVMGLLLGTLVAVCGGRFRTAFVWLSCTANCTAAMALTAVLLPVGAPEPSWRALSGGQVEFVARVAAVCVAGVGGLFGGGLLGRILREVAWEPGERSAVVPNDAEPRIEDEQHPPNNVGHSLRE